jgi:hypothetical protein
MKNENVYELNAKEKKYTKIIQGNKKVLETVSRFISNASTYVSASVRPTFANQNCQVADSATGGFIVLCATVPGETAILHYVVENLPAHIVQ